MDAYAARRKALMVTLAVMLSVPIGLIVWISGGFPIIAGWYQAANDLTKQMPINDPQYMYERALQYQRDGDSAMAMAAARRATIVDGGYTPAHKLLAAEALRNHDYQTAEQECQSVLLNSPHDGPAVIGLATAYEGMGKKEQAEQVYRDAMNAQSFDNVVRDRARRSLQRMVPGAPDTTALGARLPPSVEDTGTQVAR